MKYQFIVWLGLSLLLSIPLRAQNSIDRMVEEYSAIGGSKFTSAVERDPNTSRVKKVVKRLVVNGVNAQRFIHGFKREAQRHRHTVTNRKNDETTITMVADDKKATRVYLLKYDDRAYHSPMPPSRLSSYPNKVRPNEENRPLLQRAGS